MTRPLIVALHGVGSSARDMAAALSPLRAVADVVALDGGDPFDGGGSGRQWFSVHGVTEANRSRRVLDAVPPLLDRLDRLAAERGVAREDLVLLGFSQGAIMALAMVAQGLHPGPAIAIAGRLAAPVIPAGGDPATVLLVHDSDDVYAGRAIRSGQGEARCRGSQREPRPDRWRQPRYRACHLYGNRGLARRDRLFPAKSLIKG